jgi:hypothetical protein
MSTLAGLFTVFAQNGLTQESFNADACPGNNGICAGGSSTTSTAT